MTARAIGSGTISFGLVAIPVKLFTTSESSSAVRFSMVHKKCGTRVKYRYYCPTDDELVERDELVKGYEFAKGQYVLFSAEELKALSPEPTNAIEIREFVPLDRIDPVYFEKSYYLGPDKGGDRPYRLLSKAMRDTGRAALAKYAARGKNYLVLVRPFEEGLVMQQLRYADELKAFDQVPIGEAQIADGELELAIQLVEQIANEEFAPDAYQDEFRLQVLRMIDQKVQGQEITAAPQEAPRAQVIDLMQALKASLGDAAADSEKPAEPARKPPRRAARKGAKGKKSRAKTAAGSGRGGKTGD